MNLYYLGYEKFKNSYYLCATAGIILSSCLGGVVAMVILMKGLGYYELSQLFIVTSVCMGFNTAVLANLKPKLVYNVLIISVLTNVLLFVLNVI